STVLDSPGLTSALAGSALTSTFLSPCNAASLVPSKKTAATKKTDRPSQRHAFMLFLPVKPELRARILPNRFYTRSGAESKRAVKMGRFSARPIVENPPRRGPRDFAKSRVFASVDHTNRTRSPSYWFTERRLIHEFAHDLSRLDDGGLPARRLEPRENRSAGG